MDHSCFLRRVGVCRQRRREGSSIESDAGLTVSLFDASVVGVLLVLSVLGVPVAVDDCVASFSLPSNKGDTLIVGVIDGSIIEDDNISGSLLPYICFTSSEFGLRYFDFLLNRQIASRE